MTGILYLCYFFFVNGLLITITSPLKYICIEFYTPYKDLSEYYY